MATVAAAAGGLAVWGPVRAGESPPNMLFILSDDHRYDAMGFLDKPWLKTPALDRLAREGVHFTNSFVTTSLCSPSRASFLTGRYARCHGLRNNITPWKESNITFLEILHAAGYWTAFIGKWHMPGKGIPDLAGQGKVDRMVSFSIAAGQGIYHDCPLVVDGKKQSSRGYINDVLTRYGLEFMEKAADRPFCLYLSHKALHYPFSPSEKFRGSLSGMPLHPLEPNLRGLPLGAGHVPQVQNFKKNQQAYYETLLGLDESIGEILAFLDTRGLAENTLVVYCGDNGYFWGEHGLIDKRYAYEEGMRIPHLLRYPRLFPEGGKKVTEMVLNIDLAPTLLSAAGLPPPAGIQGRSYLELCRGKSIPWRSSFVYEYFPDPPFPHPPIKALRTPEWKFITYPGSRFADELYCLGEDPAERNDLAAVPAYATKKKELEAELSTREKEIGC